MSIVNTSANPGSDANGATVKCPFDALWRRREKVEYAPDGTAVTNRYIYKDWLVLAITDASGALLETYTHGADLSGQIGGSAGGIGGILASTQAGSPAYYHYDFNGNISDVSSTSQATLSALAYTPFGKVLTLNGPFTPRYQFSTKEHDTHTSLNYYGYRFYSSDFGRWINRDPLELFIIILDEAWISSVIWRNSPVSERINNADIHENVNLYCAFFDNAIVSCDILGLAVTSIDGCLEACLRLPTAIARLKCLEPLRSTGCLGERLQGLIASQKKLLCKAGDLIPGGLKKSPSYHSELAEKTYEEIIRLSQGKDGLAYRAKQMKKLIEQSKRLMEK